MKMMKYFSVLLALPFLTACPVKNTPRQVHEDKKEWTPSETPADPGVEAKSFEAFDVSAAYAALKGEKAQLLGRVLLPLSDFVLNGKFIERAEFRTQKMSQMIQIFNSAFLNLLEGNEKSPEFLRLKDRYYKTLFAGCSRDLKSDCHNAALFSVDTRHTRILTRMARELDSQVEDAIKTVAAAKECAGDADECKKRLDTAQSKLDWIVEDRYRLLAMGAYKRNRFEDSEFAFAYMKYSRLFAEVLQRGTLKSSYLSETHAQIFDTLIAKYQPKDLSDPEFRAFVVNFNPWTYSNKNADLFQRGSRVMFGYAARCCLYQDSEKIKLSKAVTDAIFEAQRDGDAMGKSFLQMVREIKKEHANRLFNNLGMTALVAQIEAPDLRFYNEFFFVVDRLFRGHLSTAEVEMVLANASPARVQKELPKMIAAYIRVQLAYMVLETNRFMNSIYKSDIASNEVFEAAVTRSRELSGRWHQIQAQIDLLDRMLGSYFKSTFASPEYFETNRLIKAVNRNIHYLSVYPNMIVMNYFLSKMRGKIVVNTWFGPFEIDATTVLDAFFDGGIQRPWFRFGKDFETLNRPMLLYAFEYLLSTEALNSFESKDSATPGAERGKFFELIFTKYLDDNLDNLRTEVTAYGRDTLGDARAASMKEVCSYETGASALAPRLEINFLELDRYTYAGLGDNGVHAVLSKLVSQAGRVAASMRGQIEFRLTYTKVMLDIIEADLIRSGKIARAGQPHPDTARIRANIADLEGLKRQVAQTFIDEHKKHFDCLLTLREVERRRANRLYEEERAHLGRIYDLMKPLAEIRDNNELNAKVAELNNAYFRAPGTAEKFEYKFDRIDGTTYRMSKYDLLMRMKKRIEGDVFARPTADEAKVYGKESLAQYNRPRMVSVYMPEGLVREEMVAKGTSITLYLRGDREDFIRQGMIALNGKSGSFIEWRAQLASLNSPLQYVDSLVEFYLLGPVAREGAAPWQVTVEDLSTAYVKALAADTMDTFDARNARDFGVDGLQQKSHFEGKLFEKDSVTRLPLFYGLMKSVYSNAEIHLETGPVFEALDFAQQLNNLQTFVFDPPGTIPASVRRVYGERTHSRLLRVQELFAHLQKLEASGVDAAALDPRLTRPLFYEGGREIDWYSGNGKYLVDQQKRDDLKALVKDFATRTGDFYSTREKVKVQ